MDRIKKPIHQRPPLFSKINRKKTEILICLVFFSSFYFIFKLFFFFYLTNLHGINIEMLCRKMVDALGDVQYMALLNVYISVETERWERGPRHYIILCTPRVRCSANVGRHTGPLINNEKRSEWFVKEWARTPAGFIVQEKRLRLYTQLGNGSSSILYVIAKERDRQNIIIIGCVSMKIDWIFSKISWGNFANVVVVLFFSNLLP
jgi:hypothetical protein